MYTSVKPGQDTVTGRTNAEHKMRVIDISEICLSGQQLLDELGRDADVTVIVRHDAEPIAVMPYEHYNALVETIYLLSSPSNPVRPAPFNAAL